MHSAAKCLYRVSRNVLLSSAQAYRVRVLEEDQAKQSIELGAECEDFPVKVGRLRSQVKIVVDQVKQQARALETSASNCG